MAPLADPPVHLLDVVDAVRTAADPAHLVREHWPTDLSDVTRPVRLLAIGKASVAMTLAATQRLGPACSGGLALCVPELAEHADARPLARARVEVLPADHPTPTPRNTDAARRVESLLREMSPNETLLALISGGGSAHLTLPAHGITLEALAGVSSALMKAGATIRELNTVRKHVEQLKGGRLASICRAHSVRALVLSDVIADPLDVIASGPFAPDPTSFADALQVLHARGVSQRFAPITAYCEEGTRGEHPETPKPADPCFARVTHAVIGNNATAIDAATRWCALRGVRVLDTIRSAEGEASALARELVERAVPPGLPRAGTNVPRAVILGGEPTVTVASGTGLGGPSQELALAAAKLIAGLERARVIAFSSDGRDGPTDAAGAIVDGSTWNNAAARGIDPERALREHDSHHALDRMGLLIRTGPTGTNVNHVAIALRW